MEHVAQSIVHIASLPTDVTVLDYKIMYGEFDHSGAQLICRALGQRKCRSSVEGRCRPHKGIQRRRLENTRCEWQSNGIAIVKIREEARMQQ